MSQHVYPYVTQTETNRLVTGCRNPSAVRRSSS